MSIIKKPIDLNSLVSSYKYLSKETFEIFKKFSKISVKDIEIKQIGSFINDINVDNKYLGYFYVGYTIPQVNKEFDLLRFGEDYILNVEIKSILNEKSATDQLLKNKYYLSLLGKNLKLFTYIEADHSLYQLDKNENFQKVDFEVFEQLLTSQKLEHFTSLDNLFNPSDFLVSPFNNSEKFIEGSYFLTQQQDDFKRSILKNNEQFVIIGGLPGAGKTLLLYDLAKEFLKGNEIVIIHGGELNTGHLKLKQEYGLNIIPIRMVQSIEQIKPKVIFVDESQRVYPHQLQYIINYIKANGIRGMFSIDPQQILSLRERNYKNLDTFSYLENSNLYKLSKKIRTNRELGEFIKGLFNLNTMNYCKSFENISLHYFDDLRQAVDFSEGMENEGWQIIDYTKQNHKGAQIQKMLLNRGLNAHGVLGQEFDKVLAVVGPTFYYTDQGGLAVSEANYYDPERMFYQSITRARKQIMLVVVDNPSFMSKLLSAMDTR